MNRKRDLEDLGLLYENTFVKEENDSYEPGIVQKNQETEDENPILNYEDEQELKKGDRVSFLNPKPNLQDIRTGKTKFPSDKFTRGEIIHIQNGVAFVDQGIGIHAVPVEELKRDEEEYENPETGDDGSNYDAGPNQQDMGWSSEAEKGGEQTPSAEVTGLYNRTPEGPSSQSGGDIDTSGDDPNEEEEGDKVPLPYGKINVNRMAEPDLVPIAKVKVGNVVYKLEGPASDEDENDDPYYDREEDLRSRGIDPDAEDPDADEKGKEERNRDEDQEDDNAFPEDKSYYNNDDDNDNEDEEMSLDDAIKVIKKHIEAKAKYGDDYDIEDETLNFGDRAKAMEVWVKNVNKKMKAGKKDEDELGQAMAYKKITGNEIKKESFNSHGDRDMSLLAEKYLNIKQL